MYLVMPPPLRFLDNPTKITPVVAPTEVATDRFIEKVAKALLKQAQNRSPVLEKQNRSPVLEKHVLIDEASAHHEARKIKT